MRLALGAHKAGLLGRLLAVEPDLGDRTAIAGRLRHVVLHRALVALDGEALRGLTSDIDALTLVPRRSGSRADCRLTEQGAVLITTWSRFGQRLFADTRCLGGTTVGDLGFCLGESFVDDVGH